MYVKENFDTPELSKANGIIYSNVSEFLIALGIRPHLDGFKYLNYLLQSDISDKGGVTTYLYPAIAEVFNTTPSRVERAIRHAIETAIVNATLLQLYTKLFGNFKKSPTNSQFIRGCNIYLNNNPVL